MSAAPRSIRVDSEGLELHLLEWPGRGTPIVLLHGFVDNAWSWVWFAEALATERPIYAMDFRGHGDSGRCPPGTWYYFQDYIGDLFSVFEALQIARADLVAHSMGGTVATYFAGAFPDRVVRLVLVEGLGPPASPIDAGPERLRLWAETRGRYRAAEPRVLESLEAAATRLLHHNPRLAPERAAFLAEKGTRPVEGGFVWKHDPYHRAKGAIPYTFEYHAPFLRRITSPTLLINGSASLWLANVPDLDAREELLGDVESALLEGCGHMIHHERAEEAAALVTGFWARRPVAS